MRAHTLISIVLASFLGFAGVSHAQPFPSKPLKIVVPFPPGGAADILGRVVGEHMAKELGQPVVIENRPGAGAVIGYEFVGRAPADGYTMLVVFPSFVINPSLRSVGYDPIKSFKAVGQAISVPLVIAVNPEVPAKTFAELLALARAKPGSMAYGTPGVGTIQHVFGEMLKLGANVNITHAPYQGLSAAVVALVGGHVGMVVGNVTEVAPQVTGGKVRALVVTTSERAEALPSVPTIREAGSPELEATNWAGFMVPAGTPDAVVARLNTELVKALGNPEVREKLRLQGMSIAAGTPEQFATLLGSEFVRYGKVIREVGMKLD